MSLNPASQFDETLVTTATEFAAQDEVLANSPILSADLNTIAERAFRRTRGLYNGGPYPLGMIVTQSTANGNGATITANGTGRGVEVTGGGSSGTGGWFLGGNTNGIGVEATGDGTGSGAVIQGGATGIGLEVSAGGGNTNGIEAYATGTGFALACEAGGVQFNGTQPAKTADPGGNAAHATNQVKAWAHITTDGAGNATIEDGYNIATAVPAAGDGVDLTFARAMANALYAVTVTNLDGTALFGVANYALSSTTSVRAKLFDAAGAVQQSNLVALRFAVVVHARQ
jgi:hypothetical protein